MPEIPFDAVYKNSENKIKGSIRRCFVNLLS